MYAVILDDAELNNLLMTQAIRGLPDCEPKAFTRADKALAFVAEMPRRSASRSPITTCRA